MSDTVYHNVDGWNMYAIEMGDIVYNSVDGYNVCRIRMSDTVYNSAGSVIVYKNIYDVIAYKLDIVTYVI